MSLEDLERFTLVWGRAHSFKISFNAMLYWLCGSGRLLHEVERHF